MKQLRDGGFTGQIWGQAGMAGGVALGAGAPAEGVIFTTNFHATQAFPSSQKFVAAFKAKFNKDPSQFEAEGYDGVWMVARAIKEAGCIDRECIQRGLLALEGKGFDAAHGPVTFKNRDMQAPGAIVEIKGGKEVAVR